MANEILTFLKDNGAWLSPLGTAIVGGVFGAYLVPRVQWGIEKKRETRTHRRDLVARWRAMVSELAEESAKQEAARMNFTSEDAHHALQRHADFASFEATYKRYCRGGFRGVISWFGRTRMRRRLEPWWPRKFQTSPENTFVVGIGMPARLWYMIDQIAKIEQWWGLH